MKTRHCGHFGAASLSPKYSCRARRSNRAPGEHGREDLPHYPAHVEERHQVAVDVGRGEVPAQRHGRGGEHVPQEVGHELLVAGGAGSESCGTSPTKLGVGGMRTTRKKQLAPDGVASSKRGLWTCWPQRPSPVTRHHDVLETTTGY
jgi:hypothetical protein